MSVLAPSLSVILALHSPFPCPHIPRLLCLCDLVRVVSSHQLSCIALCHQSYAHSITVWLLLRVSLLEIPFRISVLLVPFYSNCSTKSTARAHQVLLHSAKSLRPVRLQQHPALSAVGVPHRSGWVVVPWRKMLGKSCEPPMKHDCAKRRLAIAPQRP